MPLWYCSVAVIPVIDVTTVSININICCSDGATVVILLLIRRGNSAGETDNGVVVVVAVAFGDCTEGIGLPKLAWC